MTSTKSATLTPPERVKYPTVSLRMTPEIKILIDQMSAEMKCTNTALVIFALKSLRGFLEKKPETKEQIAQQVARVAKEKKESAIKERSARHQIRREQGLNKRKSPTPKTASSKSKTKKVVTQTKRR